MPVDVIYHDPEVISEKEVQNLFANSKNAAKKPSFTGDLSLFREPCMITGKTNITQEESAPKSVFYIRAFAPDLAENGDGNKSSELAFTRYGLDSNVNLTDPTDNKESLAVIRGKQWQFFEAHRILMRRAIELAQQNNHKKIIVDVEDLEFSISGLDEKKRKVYKKNAIQAWARALLEYNKNKNHNNKNNNGKNSIELILVTSGDTGDSEVMEMKQRFQKDDKKYKASFIIRKNFEEKIQNTPGETILLGLNLSKTSDLFKNSDLLNDSINIKTSINSFGVDLRYQPLSAVDRTEKDAAWPLKINKQQKKIAYIHMVKIESESELYVRLEKAKNGLLRFPTVSNYRKKSKLDDSNSKWSSPIIHINKETNTLVYTDCIISCEERYNDLTQASINFEKKNKNFSGNNSMFYRLNSLLEGESYKNQLDSATLEKLLSLQEKEKLNKQILNNPKKTLENKKVEKKIDLDNEARLIKNYMLCEVSGNGCNNCVTAAIGDWLYAQYLYGSEKTKEYLKEKVNLKPLFSALNKKKKIYFHNKGNPKEIKFLFPVDTLEDLKDFTEDNFDLRQARLGIAFRDVLADIFLNPNNQNDAVKEILEEFERDAVVGDAFKLKDGKNLKEEFKLIESFKEKFTEKVNSIKDFNSTKDLTKFSGPKKLKDWWAKEGCIEYSKALGKSGSYLTERHARLLAAKLGLNILYQQNKDDNCFAKPLDKHIEGAPTITLYFKNDENHCLFYLEKKIFEKYSESEVKKSNQKKKNQNDLSKNNENKKEKLKKSEESSEKLNDKNKVNKEQINSKISQKIKPKVFYEMLQQYFQDFDIRIEEDKNYQVYFEKDCYKVNDHEDHLINTKTGVELQVSFVGNVTNSDEGEEKGKERLVETPSPLELIIIAKKYQAPTPKEEKDKKPKKETEKNKKNSEEALAKQAKLESIAAAYKHAFIAAGGMDKDRLEIDIKEFGKNWTKEEIIAVFEKVGFKRLLIKGEEIYNKLSEVDKNSSIRGGLPESSEPQQPKVNKAANSFWRLWPSNFRLNIYPEQRPPEAKGDSPSLK